MTQRIAIIGAGLAGLTAARHLKDRGEVHLFDKSRGVGGRMSTRYAGDYEFDHGAQYFTARDPGFQKLVEQAISAGIVAPWQSRGRYLKDGQITDDTGGDRFVGTPRMNSFPKYLADSLKIETGRRVSRLDRQGGTWTLGFEEGGEAGGFDRLICAVPAPQAIALLPGEFSQMDQLRAAEMEACFAVMVGLEGAHDFGWDSLRVSGSPIAWMAVNSAKPDRNKAVTTLMIHAAPDYSEARKEDERAAVQAELLAAASEICGMDLSAAPHIQIHRWLYASVSASPDRPALYDADMGLAVCGDWCAGGRVEGAYLSGVEAAALVLR